MQRKGLNPADSPEEYEKAWPDEIAKQKAAVAKEHEEVVSFGGLYVLGTERHESRRIDNQLRGRSGRQGDPGESRFYLSLQDDLMRRFNSGLVERFLGAAGMPEETPLESKIVSNAIKSAQTQVESLNFEMRKTVLKYDDVMNKQRSVVYSERREVLEGVDIKELVEVSLEETITAYVDSATATGVAEDWDLKTLWNALKVLYPISFTDEEMLAEIESAHSDGDTLGGVCEILAYNLPPGLGSHVHWDRRLDARLAAAMMGIQAIKGVEIGDGFRTATRRGSIAHDEIERGKDGAIQRRTDRAGGTEGGMSNGEILRVSIAMKPISTVPKALDTIDVKTGEAAKAINQRSDVCAVPAAGVVAEAMAALVLAEAVLEKFGGDSVQEVRRNFESYMKNLRFK